MEILEIEYKKLNQGPNSYTSINNIKKVTACQIQRIIPKIKINKITALI